MTNYEKYEFILRDLSEGLSQSIITLRRTCSYGTITRAKAWELAGKPRKDILDKNILGIVEINNNKKEDIVVVKNSSSENSSSLNHAVKSTLLIGVDNNEINNDFFENAPKSRLLSYLAGCLAVKNYFNLSKKQLKIQIIKAVEKI